MGSVVGGWELEFRLGVIAGRREGYAVAVSSVGFVIGLNDITVLLSSLRFVMLHCIIGTKEVGH